MSAASVRKFLREQPRGEKRAKVTRGRARTERLFKLGEFPLRGLRAKLFGAAPHQRERRGLYLEAELRRLTRGAQRAHRVFGEMRGRCRADDFAPDVRGSAVRVDYAPLVVHRHAVYRRVAADEVLLDRYLPAAPRLETCVAAPGLALDAREGDLAYRAADFKQKDGEGFSGPPRLREKRGEFLRQHAADEIVPVVRRAPHDHVAHRAARKVAAPAGLSYFYEEFALVHARSSVPHKKLRSVPAADAEAKRMKFTPYP